MALYKTIVCPLASEETQSNTQIVLTEQFSTCISGLLKKVPSVPCQKDKFQSYWIAISVVGGTDYRHWHIVSPVNHYNVQWHQSDVVLL
jgi:hypothetical protein